MNSGHAAAAEPQGGIPANSNWLLMEAAETVPTS
jgi:hypothetical protein